MSQLPLPPATLKGSGVSLRRLVAADADFMAEQIADPRVHRQTGSLGPNYSRNDALEFVASLDAKREARTNFVYGIEYLGKLCGIVGLDRKSTSVPFELGYWVAPEAWGKGVASGSGKLLLDWLDTTGMRLTLASVHEGNEASLHVLKKLNFIRAGRDKKYSHGRGEDVPVHLLARIA